MQEYIWCWCHTSFRHCQINVQTHSRSNMIWRLLFCPFLLLSSFVWGAAPNNFLCSSNHSPNYSPFGRGYDVLPNWPAVLTRATSYHSCICLWHLRQNTTYGRGWEIGYRALAMGDKQWWIRSTAGISIVIQSKEDNVNFEERSQSPEGRYDHLRNLVAFGCIADKEWWGDSPNPCLHEWGLSRPAIEWWTTVLHSHQIFAEIFLVIFVAIADGVFLYKQEFCL